MSEKTSSYVDDYIDKIIDSKISSIIVKHKQRKINHQNLQIAKEKLREAYKRELLELVIRNNEARHDFKISLEVIDFIFDD